MVSRGEFLTSYTPYQAEISQGTLTTIFEFQTMICQLTGMDVANASMYDGSTAVPEAAMMAVRVTGRIAILVARTVHPEYREVLRHLREASGHAGGGVRLRRRDRAARSRGSGAKLDDQTAAVIIQSPNFFGIVEHVKAAAEIAHKHGALLVVVVHRSGVAGILEPPREPISWRANCSLRDFAELRRTVRRHHRDARKNIIRQMPGRLVGETKDSRGNRAFCLTLATREQHIRREKATSNICTNQALIALMATVFMTVYGKAGTARTGRAESGQGALPGAAS